MSTSEYWRQFSRRRLSRRRALAAGAAGAGAVGLALAGCGGDDGGSDSGDDGNGGNGGNGTPKPGGILQQGTTITALSIDPHTDVTMGAYFVPFFYGYLLHEVQMTEGPPVIVYDHAESVEQPDDVTYIFHLRPGLRFHDLPPANGREVVADDVVYSFHRVKDERPEPFWNKYVKAMTAPDPRTFRLDLNSIYAYTYSDSAMGSAIVCKEAVEQWGDLKSNGLGSGPFQVKSLSHGESLELVRNPNYHVQGIPYIDGINWRIISDDAFLRAAFRAKQLDIYTPPSKLQADEVGGYGADVVSTKEPDLTPNSVTMVETKPDKPELADVRVREAINRAIDRDAMIQRLCFGEGYYCAIVSSGLTFWSLSQEELRERYRHDPDKARQLLAAAGISNLSLELKCPAGMSAVVDIAAMIKEQLTEVGIDVKLMPLELGTFVADLSAHNYHFMVGAQLPWTDERLPMQFNHTYNYTRDQEPSRPPDPVIDGILDKILETPDPYERQALVFDVTRKIIDRQQGYMFNGTRYGARWNYVHGYDNKGFQERLMVHDMWLDK